MIELSFETFFAVACARTEGFDEASLRLGLGLLKVPVCLRVYDISRLRLSINNEQSRLARRSFSDDYISRFIKREHKSSDEVLKRSPITVLEYRELELQKENKKFLLFGRSLLGVFEHEVLDVDEAFGNVDVVSSTFFLVLGLEVEGALRLGEQTGYFPVFA